jgi:DNA-binding phage protein
MKPKRTQAPDRANFLSRLQWIIRECGGVRQLAEKSKVSRGSLTNYLENGGEPSRPHLAALANCVGVRFAWLGIGEEPMRPDEANVFTLRQDLEDPYIAIRMVNIADLLKDAVPTSSPHRLVATRSWLRSLNHSPDFDPESVEYWRVTGNLMEPDFRDGDFAVIDRKPPAFLTSGVYLFALNRAVYMTYLWLTGTDTVEITGPDRSKVVFSMPRNEFDQGVTFGGRVFGKVGRAP